MELIFGTIHDDLIKDFGFQLLFSSNLINHIYFNLNITLHLIKINANNIYKMLLFNLLISRELVLLQINLISSLLFAFLRL